jgi:hypothetical protein
MTDRGKSASQDIQVSEVLPGTPPFGVVLELAAQVLRQDRHLLSELDAATESHVLGAFVGTRRLGFLRSRSPVTSAENYALKIAAGYVLHPSEENDSYYFLRRL